MWSLQGAGENNKRALMLSLPSILVFNADLFLFFFFPSAFAAEVPTDNETIEHLLQHEISLGFSFC